MKFKIFLLAAAVLSLSGCKIPEAVDTTPGGYEVETLFTHEGCTVYKFRDGLSDRYFTNCKGSTTTRKSCGKNCTREETISGGL